VSGSQLLLLGGTPQVVSDPNFEYTTLLLPGNGTNGAQNNTFLDSSTNNFTITRNGNTTQGTFSPFSQTGWGNYFDGTGDSIKISSGITNQFAPGSAFTCEGWFYLTSSSASQMLFCVGGSTVDWNATTGILFQIYLFSGTLYWQSNAGGSANSLSGTCPSLNAWHHIAVGYNGTTTRVWVDGTSFASGTPSYSVPSYSNAMVGSDVNNGNNFYGYASNVRFVKGTDVYGAGNTSITVPTTPLTAITNTQLLTCQSNRFIDNSTNAFAITRNGDVSVQAFSPFNPTAAWSASTNGGSGYFDGSGDYLNSPATGQFAPTGNFTISMWIYPTSFAASFYVLAGSWNTGTSNEWLIQYDNTGAIRFLTTTDSTFSAAGVIKLNQWQFISISRTGSTLTGYVNGTSFRSYTLTGTVGVATKVVYIGAQQGTTWPYIGYMANFRLVDGSAESATPPTAPATAISGTNMLLNFTNAGIYDATSKNDLETVGNAQISTAQSKFGGSSMLFDGTGDWLRAPASPNLDMGTGNLTIEGWFYLTATVAVDYRMIVSDATNGNNYVSIRSGGTGGQLEVNVSGTSFRFNLNNSVTINTWFHLAVTRSGTTWYGFINGTSLGSTTNSGSFNIGNGGMFVGRFGGGTAYEWPGYMNDLRVTKGVARYTASFTAPTAAFPLL